MQIRDHAGSTKPAVILHPSGIVVTFAELEERANRLAHHLRHAGLRPGDTVAVLMENNEHVHAVMWAARRSGLYYTLVNTHLTASEIAYIVDDSGAKALISSAAMLDVCQQLSSQLRSGLPPLRCSPMLNSRAGNGIRSVLRVSRLRQSPTSATASCFSIRPAAPGGRRASAGR